MNYVMPECLNILFMGFEKFSVEFKSINTQEYPNSILPYYIDLKTQMKSHCHLVLEESYDEKYHWWVVYMRYGRVALLYDSTNVYDLLLEVKTCLHGRPFMSDVWKEILSSYGFISIKTSVHEEIEL